MAQEPFTPAGVQQKQADLYVLPDTQLKAQANLVRADFRQWVKDNFLLDTNQTNYLDGIDNRWVQLVSCQTGFAIENRLPIDLVVVGPITASKLIRNPNTLFATWGPGGFEAGGSMTFEIVYQ